MCGHVMLNWTPAVLSQGLVGERRSPGASLKALEARFAGQGSRRAERMTIVLVDEIDLLVTRNQSVRPYNAGASFA